MKRLTTVAAWLFIFLLGFAIGFGSGASDRNELERELWQANYLNSQYKAAQQQSQTDFERICGVGPLPAHCR